MNDPHFERWLRSKLLGEQPSAPDGLRRRTLAQVARTTQRRAHPSLFAALAPVAVAAAAAVLVLAVLVPLLGREGPPVGEPSGEPRATGIIADPSAAATDSAAPRASLDPAAFAPDVAAAYEVGRRSGALAAAGGYVWMLPDLEPYYLRMDPETGEVTEFSLGPNSGPGAEIDAAEDMIWASVSTPDFAPDRLVRIDPRSGGIVASVDVPATYPRIEGDYVWALLGVPDDPGTTIVQVDAATNEVVRRIETPGECDEGHIPTGRGVWCIGSDAAFAIDPETGEVEAQPELALGHPVIAVSGLIWGVNEVDRSIWAVDPVLGTVIAQLPIPNEVGDLLPDAVEVDGSIWWAGHGARANAPLLLEIDTATRTIGRTLNVADPNYLIATDGRSIYLPVLRTPFIVRVDP